MHRFAYVAIVDDDAATREAVARLLCADGIDSRSYSSARAFLDALPSGVPDCLIVDVNMSEMTGLALQRELFNLGVRIPTIVISASDDERIAASAASLGAAALILKPVGQDALMAALHYAEKKPN